jgi:hypothetical protein
MTGAQSKAAWSGKSLRYGESVGDWEGSGTLVLVGGIGVSVDAEMLGVLVEEGGGETVCGKQAEMLRSRINPNAGCRMQVRM